MTDREIINKITNYVYTKERLKKLEEELKVILYDKVCEGYKLGELLRS